MNGLFAIWRNWWERREILGQMRREVSDRSERVRFLVQDDLTYAESAILRDDRREAAALWDGVIARYPDETRDSPRALRVLIGLRRFDEADEIMRRGQKRHPRDSFFAVGLAKVAASRAEASQAGWDAVIARANTLRKRFPGVMDGFLIGAAALRASGRLDEAEKLIGRGMERFPEEVLCFLEFCRVAMDREDWPEALRRWRLLRDRFDALLGYSGCARVLIRLGRIDEAEEELNAAKLRFGSEPSPTAELARCAEARGEKAEAVKRWKLYVDRFPLYMPAYIEGAEAFERLGEFSEAETLLRAGIERFPDERRPSLELAKLFHYRRRDFAAAAEAWAAVRGAFPDYEEAYTSGVEALRQAGRPEEADALFAEHRLGFMSR
jgi:tetratricopeptide (TPR) repeat protein